MDPYKASTAAEDLAKNNPLAIDDDSPWQRHFQDEQFRQLIQQDIHRTFPDLEFFRLVVATPVNAPAVRIA